MIRLVVLAGLLALTVVGCSRMPARDGLVADPALQWELRGRLAVTDHAERWTGSLYWRQLRDGHRLEFRGPLGQGAVWLEEDAGGARLALAADEIYRGADTEVLLYRHLGWNLPVTGLRYWVLGKPRPGSAHSAVPDAEGRIATLLQDGWQMSFDRYHQVGSAWHPQRIRAVRDGIQLRLVVDAWVPGNARGG